MTGTPALDMPRFVFVFLAALAAASGQGADTSSIEGQVVSRGAGTPLAGATVEVGLSSARFVRVAQLGQAAQPNYQAKAQADEQGRFTFRNLTPGIYSIRGEKQGFTAAAPVQFVLGEQQQLKGMLLKLTAQSAIAGRVIGRNDEGVPQATIGVVRLVYSQGKAQWVPVSTLQSGERGEYHVPDIAPGHYRISATYFDSRDKPAMSYVPTYYGDTADRAAAKFVTVDSVATGIDIRLRTAATVSLRGRVVDPGGIGQPAPPLLIAKDDIPGAAYLSAAGAVSSGPDGAFEIRGVPAGEYFLTARSNGAAPLAVAQSITLRNQDVDGIVLRLGPPRDVKGTIQLEGGGAFDPRSITIVANSLDGTGSTVVATRGLDSSEFILRNVAAGRTSLTIYAPFNLYVNSVQYGAKEMTASGADITSGESLSVVVSANGGQLTGRVSDAAGKPPSRAALTLLPAAGPSLDFEQTVADRNGDFRFRMVRPGEYKLYAWDSADASHLQDPDVFRLFEGKAQRVTLEAGRTVTAPARLIPAAEMDGTPASPWGPLELPHTKSSLEGQVVNAKTGEAIKGASVRLTPVGFGQPIFAGSPYANGPRTNPAALADDQGHFEIRNLDAGAYQLSADRQGYLTAIYGMRRDMTADPLIVGEGQGLKSLTLKLSPQFVISGRVTDENGEALVQATVSLYGRNARSTGFTLIKETVADPRGEYRFESLAAGSYLIGVRAQPPLPPAELALLPLPNYAEMRYVTTYYPDAVEVAGATPIVLDGAATTARIELKLHKTPAFEIRGRLEGLPAPGTPGGIPLGAVPGMPSLRLYPKDGLNPQMPGVGTVVTHPNENFALLDVPPGSYILVARAYAVDPNHLFGGSMPIEIKDKHLDGIVVPVKQGVDVRGRVSWDPPAGSGFTGLFVSMSGVYSVGSGSASQVNERDNSLTFHNVLSLPYKVEMLELPPACKCFVKSILYGGSEIPESGTDFTTGQSLEIVLSASAATLDGTVVDRQGKPVSGAVVALAGSGPLRTGSTDNGGKFIFDGVPPGEYQLLAWEDIDPASLKVPGFLRQYEAGAKPVKLLASGRETVQAVAIPAR